MHFVVESLGFPSIKALAPKEPPAITLAISTIPLEVNSIGHFGSPSLLT